MDQHFGGKAGGAACFVTSEMSEGCLEVQGCGGTKYVVEYGVSCGVEGGVKGVSKPLGLC